MPRHPMSKELEGATHSRRLAWAQRTIRPELTNRPRSSAWSGWAQARGHRARLRPVLPARRARRRVGLRGADDPSARDLSSRDLPPQLSSRVAERSEELHGRRKRRLELLQLLVAQIRGDRCDIEVGPPQVEVFPYAHERPDGKDMRRSGT